MIIVVIAFVILAHCTGMDVVFDRGAQDLCYSNDTGSFTFEERNVQGRDFLMCQRKFAAFKQTGTHDTVLYRLIAKDPVRFWRYRQYLFTEKYQLPFQDWQKISVRRGVLINKSGFQDF